MVLPAAAVRRPTAVMRRVQDFPHVGGHVKTPVANHRLDLAHPGEHFARLDRGNDAAPADGTVLALTAATKFITLIRSFMFS